MNTFMVHIFSAERSFYEGPCETLVVPTIQGQYGILAHHCNTIGAVLPGVMTYKIPGQEKQAAAVSEGLIKIEDNDVLVLVDTIEKPEEIDENRARRAADEAMEAMLQKKSMREYREVKADMARAVSRLQAKGEYINKINI